MCIYAGSWSAGVTVSNSDMEMDLRTVHTYGTTCRNTLKLQPSISMESDWTTAILHHYMLLRYRYFTMLKQLLQYSDFF